VGVLQKLKVIVGPELQEPSATAAAAMAMRATAMAERRSAFIPAAYSDALPVSSPRR
jgi:hypothetical protein